MFAEYIEAGYSAVEVSSWVPCSCGNGEPAMYADQFGSMCGDCWESTSS